MMPFDSFVLFRLVRDFVLFRLGDDDDGCGDDRDDSNGGCAHRGPLNGPA